MPQTHNEHTSRYWLIDGLITAFTGEVTATHCKFSYPLASQVEPLTYAQAHESEYDEADADVQAFRYDYNDRAEWWVEKPSRAA
jgi:hypothetical protein